MAAASQAPQTIDLRIDRLNQTILKLSIPSVMENLLTTMVYLTDSILVGWLADPVALAAVGLSGMLMWAADGLFQAISFSALAMVARFWGQEDFEASRKVAGQTVTLGILLGIALTTLLLPLAKPFLSAMGGQPDVVRRGAQYITILLITSPLSFTLAIANSIMRATGDTRKPMFITGLMNVLNVISAYTLIFGVGPIPRLELQGAALATSTSRLVGGVMALGILFSSKTPIHLRLAHLRYWDWHLVQRIIRLSLPTVGETLVSRLGYTLFMRIVSSLGTVALAAHQIALSVESMAYMPGWGLATATAALVGQALGARKANVAESGIRRTLVMGNSAMAFIGAAFFIFGLGIVQVYGVQDRALADMATLAVRISAMELFGLCSVMILSGSLRGAGDMRTPMIVTLIGTFLFRVPTTYLFAIALNGGLKGVWLATAVDWSMRALLTLLFYLRGHWKRVIL